MMHDFLIDDIVNALANAGVLKDKKCGTISKAVKALRDYSEDKIFSMWTVDDIIDYTDNISYSKKLTREEAIEVLEAVEDGFDATIGINWDVIGAHIPTED